MASRPTVVEARHSFKAYQAAFAVIQEVSRKDSEAVVELVIKNDKGMLKDIVTWCSTTGYQLICSELGEEDEMRCLIQKGERKRNDKVMTVVISTANLEDIVYPFDKAIGGVPRSLHQVFIGGELKIVNPESALLIFASRLGTKYRGIS